MDPHRWTAWTHLFGKRGVECLSDGPHTRGTRHSACVLVRGLGYGMFDPTSLLAIRDRHVDMLEPLPSHLDLWAQPLHVAIGFMINYVHHRHEMWIVSYFVMI